MYFKPVKTVDFWFATKVFFITFKTHLGLFLCHYYF
jgi:hypothetical protein